MDFQLVHGMSFTKIQHCLLPKPLQELVLVVIFIHPDHRGDDPNQLVTGMSMWFPELEVTASQN